MKKSFFTLILFISSVILNAQQNELMFHSLGSQHGLTYSAVRDIVQDSKGYIWIATLKGLNRYDGYNIKQYYKSDDGLSSNCIEKLLLLGKDTLLMGTNEGLCLYDMMKEKFTTIVPQTKTPLYVLDMVYDGRSVFIASDSGLYTLSLIHIWSNDHAGGNLYNHSLLIINFRLYLLVISGKREVETGNVVSVRLYSL